MSVPTEFHSTLCKTYLALCISVRQPITEVKAECNAAADVREIATNLVSKSSRQSAVSVELRRPIVWTGTVEKR